MPVMPSAPETKSGADEPAYSSLGLALGTMTFVMVGGQGEHP